MANPVYTLGVELAVGSLTQLSSLCLRASFTRSIADLFTGLQGDRGLFELANDVGSLAPLLNVNLVPGRLVSFSATYAGSSFNLYKGRIKRFSNRPMVGEKTTLIESVTESDRLGRTILNTAIFTGYNAASLFTEIMTRCSVQSFTADSLTDNVDFAWYQNKNAKNAIEDLVKSGVYQAFVDGSGTFNLKSRYLGNFSTVVDTLTAGLDVNYSLDDSRIINSTKIGVVPRNQASSIQTVAYLANPVLLPASGGAGFFVTYFDPRNIGNPSPVGSIVSLVSSQDYYASANSDGTGTNFTSALSLSLTAFGASAIASIFNTNSADVWLTRFQVRGYPILKGADLHTGFDDSSSQNVYGLGALQMDDVLITNQNYIRDLALMIVGDRKNPRDFLEWTIKNEFPGCLWYSVGDNLSVVHSLAGVNSMWSVRSAQHEVSLAAGLDHSVKYNLERFSPRPWLVLDHPSYGLLDSGRQLAL